MSFSQLCTVHSPVSGLQLKIRGQAACFTLRYIITSLTLVDLDKSIKIYCTVHALNSYDNSIGMWIQYFFCQLVRREMYCTFAVFW
jgi:hypothetical protein